MRKELFLVFVILCLGLRLFGQEVNEHSLSAFSASYVSEASKDYDKAIADLGGVYVESGYEVNLRLGWLHFLKKNYEQSLKYYKQATSLKPNSIEALFGYVKPAAATEKWPEVYSSYQKILKIDPNNSIANYWIGVMYYYRKEFPTAEKHLQIVTDHYPFDYDGLLLMAQIKLAMGKLTDSKSYYQRALLYKPSNDEIRKMVNKL